MFLDFWKLVQTLSTLMGGRGVGDGAGGLLVRRNQGLSPARLSPAQIWDLRICLIGEPG